METQGYFFFAMLAVCFVAIFTAFGRKIFDYLIEKKGIIGYLVVGWVAAFILWTQAHVLADYMGLAKSEVQFAAIVVVVILVMSMVYWQRDTTWKTGKTANKVRKKIVRRKN